MESDLEERSEASHKNLPSRSQSSQVSGATTNSPSGDAASESQLGESILDEDYAAYKERLLKVMQANFIRFRSPGPKRLTELMRKTIPEIRNWDTKFGYMLRNSALKAFDNMRADFMSGTRQIAEKIDKQLVM
jgi:hypothetical protein